MGKNLVIVESPAKAKTIGRYLGKDFRITASVGHIRDLPSSKLGVDVGHQYQPHYITMKGKEKVIQELVDMASISDRILIATDPDREGEAIAWHIAQILKIDEHSDCRITFNEITEPAVKNAVAHPRPIDMNRVNSQQARRILDRLVGYELSPLLWKKVRKGLSAGRVQSVATRLIVDREREIQAFKPEEYWLLTAFLRKKLKDPTFRARYHGEFLNGKVEKRKLGNEQDTQNLLTDLEGKTYTVAKVKKGSKQKQPNAPFTTSTLQQEASRYLGFTAKKTMSVAQQLYEGIELPELGSIALVTYIRTDSVRISEEATQEARHYIVGRFGPEYLPKSPRQFQNRNKAQDAHEAIRPAHFDLPPFQIKDRMSHDQFRLYQLIWDKFIASQMAAALVDTVTADIVAKTHLFRVSGETVRFPGFLAQYGLSLVDSEPEKEETEEEGKEKLPDLVEGETLLLDRLVPEQKFTQPPARYTEASLIKALEEKGIGRPSTYAPTISTIQERKYVEKDKKYLLPTELGKVVTELLEKNFETIVDIAFTADMEKDLDTVEGGEQDWVAVLDQFYPPFHARVLTATEQVERVKIADVPTGEKCPDCQEGDLVFKEGRYGKFIACSRYPDCKYTKNLEQEIKSHCPLCGSGLVSRISKKFKGSRFYTCDKKGTDPNCPFISWDIPIDGRTCETCGSYMVWKRYRGRTYPKCGNRECPTNQKKEKPADVAAGDDQAGDTGLAGVDSAVIDADISKITATAAMTTAGKTKTTASKTKTTASKTKTTASKTRTATAAGKTKTTASKSKTAAGKTKTAAGQEKTADSKTKTTSTRVKKAAPPTPAAGAAPAAAPGTT